MQWRALIQFPFYGARSGERAGGEQEEAVAVGEWGEAAFPWGTHPRGTTEEPLRGWTPTVAETGKASSRQGPAPQ